MKNFLHIPLILFTAVQLPAQTVPDLAGAFEVRGKSINIRWAMSTPELFKAGTQYGYRIERFPANELKNDSNRKAVLLSENPLKPWPATDKKWNALRKKNRNAAIVYNLLYKNTNAISREKKEMFFGLAMKTCDLYPEIAKACGLYATDSSYSTNEIYTYRVSLYDAPKNIKYSPLYLTANAKMETQFAEPAPIRVKFGDRCAYITITKGTENYAGFWIERSADSVNFTIVNEAPLIHITSSIAGDNSESTYKDSLPENDRNYCYRARGITYFDHTSEPSGIVCGRGKAEFKEHPIIDSTTVIDNKYVRLKFRMPASFNKKRLKGFIVLRSPHQKSQYVQLTQELLSREADHYTDQTPFPSAYYKICAVSEYGDSSFSFSSYTKFTDDAPPLPPQEISGTVDTSGKVTLRWTANTEPDLQGYRVFRCNSEKEQPVELTKTLLKEPEFIDKISLNTLTKNVYYTIRAVDHVYNNSAYSSFCKLERPDKIAPTEPVFKKAAYSDSSIQIEWISSSSPDAAWYKLFRKKNQQDWKLLKEWQAKDSLYSYADTSLSIGSVYEYKLEVSDHSKNMTSALLPSVSLFPSFAPGIKKFIARPDFEKRAIHLNWQYPVGQVYSFTLYKAKGDEAFRIHKTIDARENSFTDMELYPGNKYRYMIKATLQNGIESRISEMIEVIF